MRTRVESGGRSRERRGAAAVEMACVLPLFMLLILGIIEFSRLGMVAQLLTTAAREGCRVAVIDGSTQASVRSRVEQVLEGSGIPAGVVTPTPSNWASAPQGTPITVRLTVPYASVSWLPGGTFLDGRSVTSSATMSSERVR